MRGTGIPIDDYALIMPATKHHHEFMSFSRGHCDDPKVIQETNVAFTDQQPSAEFCGNRVKSFKVYHRVP